MGKFSFRQQVISGFAVSIVLVFVVGILAFVSIRQLEDDNKWVDHTQHVIKSSTNLLQHMIDAETGMRGFAATGDKGLLEPYNEALPLIDGDLSELKALTKDNPEQLKRLDTLTTFVNLQRSYLK